MTFEVGKKYIGSTDGREDPIAYTLLFKNKTGILLENESGRCYFHRYEDYGSLDGYFIEYKKPRSITRWYNVWETPTNEIIMGGTYYVTKEDALKFHTGDWQLLDTIEVKWVETGMKVVLK